MFARRLAGCALLLGVACGVDRPDATGPPAPATSVVGEVGLGVTGPARDADGVGVTLQQWREDEVNGVFQVKIWNGSSRGLAVDELRVEWPGFADPAVSRPGYVVPPGNRVDLPVPVVAARCSTPAGLDDLPPVESAWVVVGDRRIPVTDVDGVLARLHRVSCREQAVRQRVDLRFGEGWTEVEVDGIPVLRGPLVVRRRGDDPVEVAGLQGSVLLSLDPAGSPVAVDGVVQVDVGRSGRCDGHALGESKKTYVFRVSLRLGGEPVTVEIAPDDTLRAQMATEIRRRCRLS